MRSRPVALAPISALARALGGNLPQRGQAIGLYGGSFDPVHDGHVNLSLFALKCLRLDELWWLVSPQNPLKAGQRPAALGARLAAARARFSHPRLKVTALEETLGTRYTADTLAALSHRFPGVRFVWVMGADSLAGLHRWKDWPRLFALSPIAVFDRPTYSFKALAAPAAQRFQRARKGAAQAGGLAWQTPPAWVFLRMPLSHCSSTELRRALRSVPRSPGAAAPRGRGARQEGEESP